MTMRFFAIFATTILATLACGTSEKKKSAQSGPDEEQKTQVESNDQIPADSSEKKTADNGPKPGPSPKPEPDKDPVPDPKPDPKPDPLPDPKPDPKPDPSPQTDFGQVPEASQQSIQSKLVDLYCVPCHNGSDAPGQLDLTDLTPFVAGGFGAGGYRGIFIAPGRADISAFKLVLKDYAGEQAMPPAENNLKIPTVTAEQISVVTDWINGLSAAEESGPGVPGGR